MNRKTNELVQKTNDFYITILGANNGHRDVNLHFYF